MVFGRKNYGIKVTFDKGRPQKFFYGMNRDKRDLMHNEYSKLPNVLVVQDIDK
jgi:hypothetical protein